MGIGLQETIQMGHVLKILISPHPPHSKIMGLCFCMSLFLKVGSLRYHRIQIMEIKKLVLFYFFNIKILKFIQIIYESFQLNKYKKKFYKKTTNLLTGKTEQSEHDQLKAGQVKYEVLNFWHPNITVNLITDFTPWTKGIIFY